MKINYQGYLIEGNPDEIKSLLTSPDKVKRVSPVFKDIRYKNKTSNKWHEGQIEWIRNNFVKSTNKELKANLSPHTMAAILKKAWELKLGRRLSCKRSKSLFPVRGWSEKEDNDLIENYNKYTIDELSKLMERGADAIYQRKAFLKKQGRFNYDKPTCIELNRVKANINLVNQV